MVAIGTASGSAVQRVTCWMVLLALLAASWLSTAHASRFPSSGFKQFSRHLDSVPNSERPLVFRAELMHRDHPLSPLAPPQGTTLADRWAAALERTRCRIASRGRRLADFQTPVTRIPGEYAMTLSFGTPPQKYTGLIDTGSDLVWAQCVACPGCSNFVQPDLPYDPATSSSDSNISCSDPICTSFGPDLASCNLDSTCRINYSYLDNTTIQGTLLTEAITLVNTAGESPTVPGFIVGCMNNNTGTFDGYDGIVGFGRANYSFVSQMSRASYLPVFSYCLVPITATTTNTSTMIFGASDPTNALGLVYTPIGSTDAFYNVNMTGISVNGQPLQLAPELFQRSADGRTGGVIFDSGTTFTQLSPQIVEPLKQSFASLLNTYPAVNNTIFDFCFTTAGLPAPVYPNVTFHFGGVDGVSVVNYDLADYNLFGEVDPGVTCLLINSATDNMIIGNVQMGNHYIETDETANMRIGWVSKDCTV